DHTEPVNSWSHMKEAVKDAINDISNKYDFLVFRNRAGNNLKKHNKEKLIKYFESIDKSYALKHLQFHQPDLDLFIDTISEMPNMILIMHHSGDADNFKILFQYIDSLINEKHPEAIKRRSPPPDYILEADRQLKAILERKKQSTKDK
ncbi:hypothetical protein LCGC14_2847850, partial [marine sediment metagenome]